MREIISIEELNTRTVNMKRQYIDTINGVEVTIGEPFRNSYGNHNIGRAAMQTEVPEPYSIAIMAIWGSSPTVDDVAQ